MRKSSHARRKSFLLTSNQQEHHKTKRWRNRFLSMLSRVLMLRKIVSLFRVSWIFILIFVCMGGFIVFALFSPYFQIKRIEVIRNDATIDPQEVLQVLQPLYGTNLLFLQYADVEVPLKKHFPEFRSVDVHERWPDEVELEIEVSPALMSLLHVDRANFWTISEDGVILEEAPRDNLPLLKLEQYDKEISLREQFTDAQTLQTIMEARTFIAQELKLPVNEVRYLPTAHEVHIISRDNMQIWIDLRSDLNEQLKKLLFAPKDMGLYEKPIEHIDLRIPNQLFWLPRE